MHELSNEGARTQFEKFLEERILPEMVNSAQVSPIQFSINTTSQIPILEMFLIFISFKNNSILERIDCKYK